jgi:hypothetical protein
VVREVEAGAANVAFREVVATDRVGLEYEDWLAEVLLEVAAGAALVLDVCIALECVRGELGGEVVFFGPGPPDMVGTSNMPRRSGSRRPAMNVSGEECQSAGFKSIAKVWGGAYVIPLLPAYTRRRSRHRLRAASADESRKNRRPTNRAKASADGSCGNGYSHRRIEHPLACQCIFDPLSAKSRLDQVDNFPSHASAGRGNYRISSNRHEHATF